MPVQLKESSAKKARFVLVGAVNTAIDFGLLFLFTQLGLVPVVANIISTTSAFSFSFAANRRYTFRSESKNLGRELVSFAAVTLFGLWVLQSIVLAALLPVLEGVMSDDLSLLVGKLAATIVSLVWNFVLYDRVVFRAR